MAEKKFSFFKFLIYLLATVMAAGMCACLYFVWLPKDLGEIEGKDVEEDVAVVDLKEKMQAAKNGLYEITVTEEEINLYLASKLKLMQDGFVDDYVQVKGVYVDLKPDNIEVIIEREIDYVREDAVGNEIRQIPNIPLELSFLPMGHTVSMNFKLYTEDLEGGKTRRITEFHPGSLGLVPLPGQFVLLVKPSFDEIYEIFKEEVSLASEQMTRIEVLDGLIKMDPRRAVRKVSAPGQ